MATRTHRITAILTIFLGLWGLISLNMPTALSAENFEVKGVSGAIAVEARSLLTVRLPVTAIRHFAIVGGTIMIRMDGFWMLVENQMVHFEFQTGYLLAHLTIPDTGAQIIASPTVKTFDNASGEFSDGVEMRRTVVLPPDVKITPSETKIHLVDDPLTLIASGIHLAGNFITSTGSKVAVGVGSFGPGERLGGEIVIDPLLTSLWIISR